MSDLVEFLRARLDEDEAVARAAGPDGGEWFARDQDGNLSYGEFGWWVSGPAVETEDSEWGQAVADHIACHDPDRVLREVEAKRRIVHEFVTFSAVSEDMEPTDYEELSVKLAGIGIRQGLSRACAHLAAAYSDHPDYRDEWKP